MLAIANRGLEDDALCDEVCRRAARTETEAMIAAAREEIGLPVTTIDSSARPEG